MPAPRSIGTKLLAIILPCLLIGSFSTFLLVERLTSSDRMGQLSLRLDTFAVTLSSALVKPLWEFDDRTVERLLHASVEVPELLEARLTNPDGQLIASADGRRADGYQTVFRRTLPLLQRTPEGDVTVGRLEVAFHDGLIQEEIHGLRTGSLLQLGIAFLLLAGTTLFAVRFIVARPLGRLRDSIYRNATLQTREALVWSGRDELGEVVLAYNQLLDEIEQRTRHIHRLATQDSLTGLPNRELLEDRLGHAIAVAERQGRMIAVLFADIDNFKVVNDTLGHKQGDQLLVIVAERMRSAMRGMDTIARWGGDEFVLVIENISTPGEASNVAEKLIEAVGIPISLSSSMLRLGLSVGISLYPQDGADVTSIIKNADMALFEAKGGGRNTYHFFDQAMNLRALKRLDAEVALRQAIALGELELHYQPKVVPREGVLAGAEALVRWRRPGEGVIPPGDFIPQAEESDLIVAIGEWVLREACAQIRRWQAAGFGDIAVAVNMSTRHFLHERDVDGIIAVVEAAGVSPALIEIEVTESTVMREPEHTVTLLRKLRDCGFGIAIDDFGTGYSNLSYLRRLPIRTLKIDRAFIADLGHSEGSAEIIRAIIAMTRALGLDVVAEGVETEQQLRFLADCDCTLVQGYYLSRPLPADMFETLLAGQRLPVEAYPRVLPVGGDGSVAVSRS